MKTYYALWIPTTRERTPPFMCEEQITKKLEDSVWLGGYRLKGTLDSTTLDITIEYESTHIKEKVSRLFRKSSNKTILLHREEDVLRYGLVVYSSELPDTGLDELQKGFSGKMSTPLYHFVKAFYHKHTHHHSSQDSLLQAYSSPTAINLKTQYDDIVNWYIVQYQELLKDFCSETSEQIHIAKKRIREVHNVRQGIKTLGDVVAAGIELRGQLRYLDFLIDTVAHQYSISKCLRTEIKTLRDEANTIIEDASTAYNLSTAALGVRYGIYGIRWGIAGIAVSCATFVASTCITCAGYSSQHPISPTIKDEDIQDTCCPMPSPQEHGETHGHKNL